MHLGDHVTSSLISNGKGFDDLQSLAPIEAFGGLLSGAPVGAPDKARAFAWLAGRLRWERRLGELRAPNGERPDGPAPSDPESA